MTAAPDDGSFVADVRALLRRSRAGVPPAAVDEVVTFLRDGSVGPLLGTSAGEDPRRALASALEARGGPETWCLGDVYRHAAATDPAVLLRWSHLLWALVLGGERVLDLPDDRWRPEALLDQAHWIVSAFEAVRSVVLVHPHQRPSWEQILGVRFPDDPSPATPLTHVLLEALEVAAQVAPGTTLRAALRTVDERPRAWVARLPDIANALERHAGLVAEALREAPFRSSVAEADRLALLRHADDTTLAGLAPALAARATSGAGRVREAALALLERCGPAGTDAVWRLVTEAGAPQRAAALGVLHARARAAGDEEALARVVARAQADGAAAVRAVVAAWQPLAVDAEPVAPATARSPVAPADVDPWLDDLVARAYASWVGGVGRLLGRSRSGSLGPEPGPLVEVQAQVRSAVLSGASLADTCAVLAGALVDIRPVIAGFAAGTPVRVALRVLGVVFGDLVDRSPHHRFSPVISYRLDLDALRDRIGRFTLDDLADAFEDVGEPHDVVAHSLWQHGSRAVARAWPWEDVEPYVRRIAETPGVLDRLLADPNGSYWAGLDRARLFADLGRIDPVPPRLRAALLDKALAPARADRVLAQDALAGLPALADDVVAALGSSRADVRRAAADWAGRVLLGAAAPALDAAVRRETNDAATAAMLEALRGLGRPVEQYLDVAALSRAAAKGLAKGVPADLGWLDRDAVPDVRWAAGPDAGAVVPRDVVLWWVVRAVRGGSAEPDLLLRLHVALADDGDRHRLAEHLLAEWMGLDQDEQGREARSVRGGRSLAIACKGVLAVVGACGGPGLVRPAEEYITVHYGYRPHQGRALIAMLAYLEEPAATALLLRLRRRFRTASFREEADRQLTALADRKGWSIDELGDRTVGSAGFDDDGRLVLDHGGRAFTAVVRGDLTVALLDPDGTEVKALPAPRRSDDADLARAAKTALARARKDLTALVTNQTERLHEAMCTQRVWRSTDWETYLNRHPVVRRLAQRLVWLVLEEATGPAGAGSRVVGSFRPLDDGTLTDVEDCPVVLAPDVGVTLAHDLLLDGAVADAWLAHLHDYAVTPLFAQLGRCRSLPPADPAADGLDEIGGVTLGNLVLRGRAARGGWTQGPRAHGATVVSYERRFPGTGITAEVQHTGFELLAPDRDLTLEQLTFYGPGGRLRLADVPPVMLAECRADALAMAGLEAPVKAPVPGSTVAG